MDGRSTKIASDSVSHAPDQMRVDQKIASMSAKCTSVSFALDDTSTQKRDKYYGRLTFSHLTTLSHISASWVA